MSSDGPPSNGANGDTRNRRSSITQAAFSNLFGRSGSMSNGSSFPPQSTTDAQRRRLSVNTLGLSGSSPTQPTPFGIRRGSISTNSDSIDESAVEDDEPSTRTAPTTPFVRRMSFGGSAAMRQYRPGGSPGNGNNPTSPPPVSGRQTGGQNMPHARSSSITAALSAAAGRRASSGMPATSLPQASNTTSTRAPSDNTTSRADQQGFNWSDHFKSRAESTIAAGARPSFSAAPGSGSGSPPRGSLHHDRAKSVSDMPQPPAQAASVKPKQERPKPDHFQERILKGDFYMD